MTMPARPTFPSASQRPLPLEARALAMPARPQRPALAAVAGLAVLIMLAPPVVAAISIVDSSRLAGLSDWLGAAATWLDSLAHARVLLVLPLVAMVARGLP